MATTITTVNPPPVKAALAWNWQDQQAIDPLASQPIATLAAGLKTGTRADGGAVSNPPLYVVRGVNGIAGPGGSQGNGVMKRRLAAGAALTVVGNGTSGATAKTGVAATGASTTGLTVNLTAAGGVVTGATVSAPGTSDAVIGSLVTVTLADAGTTTDVTLRV